MIDLNTSSSDTLELENNDINLSSNASFQCHKDDNYIVLRRNNFNGQWKVINFMWSVLIL